MTRLALLLVFVAACTPAPRPVPPPPPPAKEVAPPPPPKCEALTEKCTAERGAKTKIGEGAWTIALPAGWTYAKGEGVVAVTDSAALSVTGYDVASKGKPKEKAARRDAAVAQASSKIDVKPPKKLTWPKSPKRTSKIGGIDVSLYQFSGATRGSDQGPLLVFTAPLSPERSLIGVAFVSNRDTSNADAAILEAIGSLEAEQEADAGSDAASAP